MRLVCGECDEPMAAASIGQVHRARLFDGTRVVVKIQYPGIADAIRSDLKNVKAFTWLVPLFAPGLSADALMAEVERILLEELDYRAEAAHQHRFATAYRGHPFIVVPDVIAGASGPVQLTKWKVAALRIIARMDLRGFVTRQDFREIQIDPRRWTGPGGWSIPGAVPGQFARGPKLDFDRQHPVVYAAVLAEERKKFEKRGLVEPLPPGGAIQVGMETA